MRFGNLGATNTRGDETHTEIWERLPNVFDCSKIHKPQQTSRGDGG